MEAPASNTRQTRSSIRKSARLQEMTENHSEEPQKTGTNDSDGTPRKRTSSKESTRLQKRGRLSSHVDQASLGKQHIDADGEKDHSDTEQAVGDSPLVHAGTPTSISGSGGNTGADLNFGKGGRRKQPAKESGNKRKRQLVTEGSDTATKQDLIEIIKYHAKFVRRAAKSWVERYEADHSNAFSELLSMLFQACGIDYKMEARSLDEVDVDDVVLHLVTRAKQGSLEDYFGSKQRELRNFKDNLITFWDTLVLETQNGPLFDRVFMDKCMDYVIALSCTPPRVFRQVTTLVGLQLVTSLITVAKTLGGYRETAQRQLNAEKKKKKDGLRVESLNKSLSETHGKITMAEEMMRKIFTGLFMHRYRDVDPDIRMACIKAIGSWILSYPSLFLQDLYLKYIGWTLNDKHPGVRKTSIIALQNLYEVDDNVPSLGLFTTRFCKRMIELADDIEISVAVSAIGLLKQLLRHQLLGDENLGPLYDLLIDESPLIRHAVGDLVYDHLIAQKFSSSQVTEPDGELSTVQLKRLLQILREFSSDPILSDYVIDAVWEEMKAMKDWKCIMSMLLDDNQGVELTDQDATNLVRVLCASVKKAVGEKIVPSQDGRRVNLSKTQKEALEANKREFTGVLIKTYHKLLRKFIADTPKVAAIVEIIMYMDLEIYSLKQQEQAFKQVLHLLKDAFFKHGEETIQKACIKALSYCANESQADLKDSAEHMIKLIDDQLVLKLGTAIKHAGESDEYSLSVNLSRLHQLHLNKSVINDSLFNDLLGLMENFNNLDDEVVRLTLLNMFLHILWSLNSINPEEPDEVAMSTLVSKRTSLIKQLECFIDSVLLSYRQGNSRNLLNCTICVILSDLWSLFSEAKLTATKLQPLGFCPPGSLLEKFWRLCEYRLNETDVEDDDDEEDVTEEHLDYLNQKNVIMSAAAKLIAHDLVPKDFLAAEVVSHFVLHGKGVAETVKHLLALLKKNMKMPELADLYLEAMKRAYHRHVVEMSNKDEDWSRSRSFLACRELASRLAATFSGSARNMYKSSILKIAKGGVEYAFTEAPKQLAFLEAGVLQFALKLQPAEMQDILTDIEKRVEGVDTDEDPSSWRPYHTFVDYLREKAPKVNVQEDKDATAFREMHPFSRRAYSTKGRKLFEGDDVASDEEQINGSDNLEEEGGEADDTPSHPRRQASKSNIPTRSRKRKAASPQAPKAAVTSVNVADKISLESRNSTEKTEPAMETQAPAVGPFFGSATEELLPA